MLKAVAERDLSGLGDNLFYFLDRDFDPVEDDDMTGFSRLIVNRLKIILLMKLYVPNC